jgi:hypothetical protein
MHDQRRLFHLRRHLFQSLNQPHLHRLRRLHDNSIHFLDHHQIRIQVQHKDLIEFLFHLLKFLAILTHLQNLHFVQQR